MEKTLEEIIFFEFRLPSWKPVNMQFILDLSLNWFPTILTFFWKKEIKTPNNIMRSNLGAGKNPILTFWVQHFPNICLLEQILFNHKPENLDVIDETTESDNSVF